MTNSGLYLIQWSSGRTEVVNFKKLVIGDFGSREVGDDLRSNANQLLLMEEVYISMCLCKYELGQGIANAST